MNIRDAASADAPTVGAILNRVIRETTISFKPTELSDEDIRQAIASASGYFIAEVANRVVGFASYGQFRDGGGYAHTMEHTVMVAENARGQGVGEALMAHLEDHARQRGVGSLWAGVSGDNPGGKAFHARLGFEEVAVLPKVGFKFGAWRDLTLMRKWIAPVDDAADQSR